MTNLVPLYIDKDTGEYIATKRGVANSSAPSAAYGFRFTQPTPITEWVIGHFQENDAMVCQIYDSSGVQVFPDGITIIDINTIKVDFTSPQSGSAHLMFFNAN